MKFTERPEKCPHRYPRPPRLLPVSGYNSEEVRDNERRREMYLNKCAAISKKIDQWKKSNER